MSAKQNHDSSIGERPTVIDIDLSALSANLAAVKKFVAPARVMAIVKANAYGHGIVPCAQKLAEAGVDALGVAFLEEGVALRDAGIQTPVLVLGGLESARIQHYIAHNLEMTASSVAKLEAIESVAGTLKQKARVHLKIDTGMGRIGQSYRTAELLLERSLRCVNTEVVGIYSHFATGEEADQSFAQLQLERFNEVLSFYERRSLPRPVVHMANSGALLQLRESHFDMVRTGLCVYGIAPAPHLGKVIAVKPVLSLRSAVVYFKTIPAGTPVSYGCRWQAPTDTRVVTVPIGYGDGFPRAYSNRGVVLIRGKRCSIRGSVCMDQLVADLGPSGTGYNGDEVVIIGSQGPEELTVGELADLANTVPHEVVTLLNSRIPRRFKP
jgi:alanine racemase